MIMEFAAGFAAAGSIALIVAIIKLPWLKLWGQYQDVILSVDKSNKGTIKIVPRGRGQFSEIKNPAGSGTILLKSTPIWVPELKQRWFLHYGEQCITIDANKAAAASHFKSLGIGKKDLTINLETKGKTAEQIKADLDAKLRDMEQRTDLQQPELAGVLFDIRDCIDYFATVINPEEIDALTDAAAIKYTGLRRMLEQAKKGLNWMTIIIIIFGAIAAFFVLPSILGMLGV
jgi:hypothetical protein